MTCKKGHLLLAVSTLALANACGRSAIAQPGMGEFPVTVRLEPGQVITVTDAGRGLDLRLESGDVATFDWNPDAGTLTLNDVQVRPALDPAVNTTSLPRAMLLELLDSVPRMRELAGDRLDEETLLRAYHTWVAEKFEVEQSLRDHFAVRVEAPPQTASEREAAERAKNECLAVALSSSLVEHGSAERAGVLIHFAGDLGDTFVELLPRSALGALGEERARLPQEQALGHVKAVLMALRAFDPVSIELGQGKFEVTQERGVRENWRGR
jgi:hypothetical protein